MFATSEEHIRNEVLREDLYLRRHESGVPVYLCTKPGFQKRYACFATNFGSVDASFATPDGQRHDVPDGVAHFLEHKLFEGKDGPAFDEFARIGAASNAYTGFGVTNYLFSCSTGFDEGLSHLIRFVQEPYFTEENVEKEKGIIAQEIQMYEDNPGWRSFCDVLECLYQAHPIRKNIAGTVESISAIDTKVLYDCYRTFYHPENMVLFAIGDIDRTSYFELCDRILGERTWDPLGKIERFYAEEPAAVAESSRRLAMEVSMPRVLIGFKDRNVGFGGRDYLRKELVTDLLLDLLFGKSSALFERLYREKLVDDGFSAGFTGLKDAGHSLLGGETPDPEQVLSAVTDEIARLRREGLSRDDFEREKRAVMGSFFRQFNSLEFIANNFCRYLFSDANLFEIIEILHGVEFKDVEDRLQEHLDPDSAVHSIVEPSAEVAA